MKAAVADADEDAAVAVVVGAGDGGAPLAAPAVRAGTEMWDTGAWGTTPGGRSLAL